MTNEFKKISGQQETRYVLESGTTGGTSTGGLGGSIAKPMGGMQRRATLVTSEDDKLKQKPRQGPLRTQTGGGKHKDKTKTIPRKEKYKRALAELAMTPGNEKVSKEINRLAQMYPGIPPEQAIYIELGKQNATNQQQGQEIRQLSRTAIGLGKDLSEKEKRFRDIDARLKSGEITQDQADEERRQVEKEYPGAERQTAPAVKKSDKTKSQKEPEKTSEPRTKNDKSVEMPKNIRNVQTVEPGETPQATPTVQPEPKIVQPEPKIDRGVGLSHMAQQLRLKDLPSTMYVGKDNSEKKTTKATAPTVASTANDQEFTDPADSAARLLEQASQPSWKTEGDPNQGAYNLTRLARAWKARLPSVDIQYGQNKSLRFTRAQVFAIMTTIGTIQQMGGDVEETMDNFKKILADRELTVQWLKHPEVQEFVNNYPKWEAQQLAKQQNQPQRDLLSPSEPEQQELFRDSYLFDLSNRLAEELDTVEAYEKKTAGEKLAKRVEKHKDEAGRDLEFQRRQQALKGIGDRMKPKNQDTTEAWSEKYKRSINCSHPKGFSQKAHCAGKSKHNEDFSMEMTCPDCGMCETHGDNMMEVKQRLDARCWHNKKIGKPATKIKGRVRVNNCVPREGVAEGFLNEASSDEAWELVGQPVPEIQQFVKQMGYGNDEQSVEKITPIIDRASSTQIPAASIPKLKNLANKGNDAQTLKAIQQISGRPDA